MKKTMFAIMLMAGASLGTFAQQSTGIDLKNLKVSILKVSMVICLWFFFAYVSSTILALPYTVWAAIRMASFLVRP